MTTTTPRLLYRLKQVDTVNGKEWVFDTVTRVWVPLGSTLETPFTSCTDACAMRDSLIGTPRMITTVTPIYS